jgi:hypothetical protein
MFGRKAEISGLQFDNFRFTFQYEKGRLRMWEATDFSQTHFGNRDTYRDSNGSSDFNPIPLIEQTSAGLLGTLPKIDPEI